MDSQLTMIPVLLLHGLVYGMLIFLVASGLTLVLGLMDILNFAHVSVYMVGAFICYQVMQSMDQQFLVCSYYRTCGLYISGYLD